MFLKIPMGVPAWDNRLVISLIKEIISGDIFRSSKYQNLLRQEICKLLNVKYCLLTDLGRIALEISLKVLKLKAGDGVILPSYVCANVLYPILKLGCEPQFADIGSDLNISPESVEKVIKSNTKVIIVPHLYGNPAPIKEIKDIARKRGLFIIDDAAQSLGAKIDEQYTGTFGDIGILSFGPFKVISATHGGALITNNKEIFEEAKKIYLKPPSEKAVLNHFLKSLVKFKYRKYFYNIILKKYNFIKNSRNSNDFFSKRRKCLPKDYPKEYIGMSNLDAYLIYFQLKKLDKLIKHKKILGKILFKEILSEMPELLVYRTDKIDYNIFLKFAIKLPESIKDKFKIIKSFLKSGIEAQNGYKPLHLNFNNDCCKLFNTEKVWPYIVTLPINHDMNIKHIKLQVQTLKTILKRPLQNF